MNNSDCVKEQILLAACTHTHTHTPQYIHKYKAKKPTTSEECYKDTKGLGFSSPGNTSLSGPQRWGLKDFFQAHKEGQAVFLSLHGIF